MDGRAIRLDGATLRRLSGSAWWRLVALCVGLNLVETVLVMTFEPGVRPDLATQASAVAPFGVFHDLRWVSVYHDSWITFAGEVVALVLGRGALTAAAIGLAWPRHVTPVPAARRFGWGVVSSAISILFLAPSVTLLFGTAVVPVSWLFLAAVPAALLVALLVHPVAADGRWWRHTIPIRGVVWIVAAFFVTSVASVVQSEVPPAVWPIVVVVVGCFNAWSWVGVVHAVVDRRPRYPVPLVPVGLAALVGIVIIGTTLGFEHARPPRTVAAHGSPSAGAGPPVLLVSGYGSTWDGAPRHPLPGAFLEQPFSYRGLGPGRHPLPYGSADTVKPLAQLDRMLVDQLDALHAATGRTPAVVAESEGALVAKTALLTHRGVLASTLVMASPLVEPGRVSYPTGGSGGWGVASAEGMRLLSNAFQSISPIDLSPSSAFLVSVDRAAPSLERTLSCPIAGVQQVALLPLADALVTSPDTNLPFPTVVVPAFHGGVVESAEGARLVVDALHRVKVQNNAALDVAERVIRSAASAWGVPSLTASDFPPAGPAARQLASCPGTAVGR